MIVELNHGNLEMVVSLRIDIFKKMGKIKTQEEAAEMMRANQRFVKEQLAQGNLWGFIEKEDSHIISIALALRLTFPPINVQDKGNWAYIFNVYTDERHRNQGKATYLLQKIITRSKESGINKIALDANDISESLYQELGFVLQNNHMIFTV
jgi:predicted GNAT family acetyltransferase